MKLKIFLALMVMLSISKANAQTSQEKDSMKKVGLNEIVISGNKFVEKKKNIIQKITVVNQKQLSQMNAQSIGDALINTGEVFVQKSQQGSGSPVLRGFEASRVQLSVDGIRMNNAIYRTGHLQNSMTVDNNALDRIEVLFGPASTIHGSDALGGVVALKTVDAQFGKTKNKIDLTGANAAIRYSTANQEKMVNVGLNWGSKRFASYTNMTYTKLEDLVQGKNGVDSIMNLWKKNFIVERINGVDSMVANANPYKQISSGFGQVDVLQKFAFKQNNNTRHGLNFQLSTSTDVPRYDRLSETTGSGIAKSAEWYYGPQKRTMLVYSFDKIRMNGFFNDLNANISNQWVEESRHNRSFGASSIAHRTEKIMVTGYNVALRHKDKTHELTIGSDGQLNNLKSTAFETNIFTNVNSKIDTRYPDGKNNMNLLGIFAQHIMKLNDDKVIINDGLRVNFTSLHSTLIDTAVLFHIPILDLKQNNRAVTGNLGIAYMPTESLRMTANFSTGFRSPNFDDMTKVFESNNSQFIVPNVNLKPEYTQNTEIGLQYNSGAFEINTYGFYTNFQNAIVTDKFTYNGDDSILYNGSMTPVYASQNKAKAFVYGGGFNAVFRPEVNFSIYSSLNYTFGRFNNDSVLVPLDHISPVTGRIGMKYETKIWYTELYSLFNGKKKLIDYNPNGEDNIKYSTPQGTPSWYTINFRAGAMLTDKVQLQVGVENILDKNYRYFASGISAPGRNFVVSMRFKH